MDEIAVVDHDPVWRVHFVEERARLRVALGPLAPVFAHIGSTAVPGLAAKPVIDILIGARVPPPPWVDLSKCAYEALGERGIPGRYFFRRGRPRSHHLHWVDLDGALWRRHLDFRDALRSDSRLAARYANLKRCLAGAHFGDREAYSAAKSAFIEATLTLAARRPASQG